MKQWHNLLTWISLGVMFAAVLIGLSKSGGEFGPEIWTGWPNRFLVATTAYG